MIFVAPYVGAWIETLKPKIKAKNVASHPTWVRGLKPMMIIGVVIQSVAPYVGAWIETLDEDKNNIVLESHPTWVRGLKLQSNSRTKSRNLSHPTWVRGLKLPQRIY